MADQLPDLAVAVRNQIADGGDTHSLIDKLATVFADRAKWVKGQLARTSKGG